MQTKLKQDCLHQAARDEAEAILRSCVHCGFCTATCPTYQLLGDELDGPRGRIYLIKQMLEGQSVSSETQGHLDRCLGCRACETTCPSGVQYSRLLDLGRECLESKVPRTRLQQLQRQLLRKIVPEPQKFSRALKLGQALMPLLPSRLRKKIPLVKNSDGWPQTQQKRRMVLLEGCVQQATRAQTNASMAQLLNAQGVELRPLSTASCCGAVSHHSGGTDEAIQQAKHNIDLIIEQLDAGAEAVLMSASGCGSMLKEYQRLLQYDTDYADKAARVSTHSRDLCEVIDLDMLKSKLQQPKMRIAFQSPCSLQHGQQLSGRVEALLIQIGYELVEVEDSHQCCGSAGSYSLLQPEISQQLLDNKLANLEKQQPEAIVTANIGCELHLSTQAQVPVIHWIDLLAEQLKTPARN